MQKKKVFGFILMLIAVIAISFGGKVTHAAEIPKLMEREASTYISGSGDVYYAIGASRSGNTKYTADSISTITFVTNKNVPDTAEASWDVSYTSGDGEVIAWVIPNSTDSTKYDLYIGADSETIEAPENSEGLFINYKICTEIINLSMIDTSKVTTMKYMFFSCQSLTDLDVSNFNTSNVTSMYSMFNWCSSLTSLNVSNFDTSNVTDMYSMFNSCSNLTSLDLSNFNTSKVYDMGAMFNSCSSLISVNVSGLDTSNVSNMNFMFYSCNGLTSLDLSDFDTSSASNISYMLLGCSNLKTIILDKSITDSSQVIRLGEGVMQTPAFIYVADTTSEKVYEESSYYVAVYGSGRAAYKICPILEVVGENPVKIGVSETYDETDDSGVTIAGFTKTNASEYERYGYSYTTSGLPVDTSTKGTKEVVYTLTKTQNGITTKRTTITRNIDVIATPKLMEREASVYISETGNVYYAIGASRSGNTKYTADLINSITFTTNKNVPNTAEASWDASYISGDGEVIAWVIPSSTDSTKYDLYIGADDVTIEAPEISDKLFGSYTNCTNINNLEMLDTSKVTSMFSMFGGCSSLTSLDVSNFNVANVTDMSSMFSDCSTVTKVDLSSFDTSKVTDMSGMFFGCTSFTNLNLSSFNTSKVANMIYMFNSCESLINLDLSSFDTSRVTNMVGMFSGCTSFTSLNLSGFNTSNVTKMMYMFDSCESLINLDLSSFDTSNVTDMNCMFQYSSNLMSLDITSFNTSKVTNMGNMFYYCSSLKSLDLSSFNTSSVTSMFYMFNNCASLTNLDLSNFDTSNVTNMACMFTDCSNLKSLNVSSFNTSKTTSISNMFQNCGSLTSLDLSSFTVSNNTDSFAFLVDCSGLVSINISNFEVAKGNGMFYGCTSLKAIILDKKITSSSEAMQIASGIYLDTLPNAILYVPDAASEKLYEQATNYSTIFKDSRDTSSDLYRIRPILELIGDTQVSVKQGGTYDASIDKGVTIAGFDKTDASEYKKYGYDYTVTGLPVDTTTGETKQVKYTLTKTQNGTTVNGMTVIRNIKMAVPVTITYNANGGTFTNGSATNVVTYSGALEKETITKISKTSNVSDDGSTYTGGYGENKTLTDKITILGATELKVTITYATEGASLDWVCVYDGSVTPSANNYSNSISGKLGGKTKTTTTYNIPGDTVQFFFRSDGYSSNYYGYYAVVEAEGDERAIVSGVYKEPAINVENMKFGGWYTDVNCTAGNEFNLYNDISSTTVYAKYVEDLIASGVTGGVSWKIYRSGLLEIYPTNGISGTMNDLTGSGSGVPWYNYITSVTSVLVKNGVNTNKNVSYMFYGLSNCTSMDLSGLNTINATNMENMFYSCSSLTTLNLTNFNTSNVTSMQQMFYYCSSLTTLNVSSFNTSNVTNMTWMFRNCSSLTTLNLSGFDTSKVTNMGTLFADCNKLTSLDLSKFDTSQVTNMSGMFRNCYELSSLNINNFNTSKVTDMSSMFDGCSSLTTLNVSSFNTSKTRRMDSMFRSNRLTNLDVSNFDTSNVTNMSSMFEGDWNLTSLDLSNFNTSKVTNMSGMFRACYAITELDLSTFDTSNVTDMSFMFDSCKILRSLNLSNFNTSKVTSVTAMFQVCSKLTAIILDKSITSPDQAMMLLSGMELENLPNAIIYVHDEDSEKLYEQASNYATILKDNRDENGDLYRVRPLLEVAGDNPIIIAIGKPYNINMDKGATIAGFDKDNENEYTKYGYNYTISGFPVDTTVSGVKQITYTLTKTKSGTTTNGMTATRDVEVGIKPFTDISVSLPQDKYGYTGSEIKPEPTVKDGNDTLIKGTDYDVSYKDNIDVGIATVIITAKGGYTGTKEITFEITTGTMSGIVSIKGVNKVGSTLTVDTSGIVPKGCLLKYQWYVSSENSTQNGTAIDGARNESYVVTSNDVEKYIYVEVTASKKNYATTKFADITDAENNKYAMAFGDIDRKPTIRFSQRLTDDGAVEITAIIKSVNGIVRISVNNSTINSSEYQDSIRKDNYEITITLTYTAYINGRYVFEVEDNKGNITQEVENVSILGTLNPVITYKKYNATYYSDARIEFESSVPVRITSPDSYTADGITFSTKYYSTKITATIAKGKEFNTDKVFTFTNEKSEQIDVTVEAPIFTDNVSIRMIKEAVTSMNVTIKEAYALSENMKSNKVMLGKKVDSYYGINSDTKIGVATGNELNLAQVLGNSSKTSSLNSYGKIEDTPSTSIKANANSDYMNKNATGVYKKTDGLLDVLMLTMSSLEKYNTFRITINP